MNAWVIIHTFWTWGVAIFSVLAGLADAAKGFKWSKMIVGMWMDKLFGLTAFKQEVNARFTATDAALKENYRLMTLIAKEMTPNGGSSLRDVVNKIDDRVDQIDARQILNAERVKALSTDSPVGIQEFNTNGEMVWCNRTYLRMTNRDLTEVLGYGWINSLYPDDRERVKSDWLAAVNQGMAYESEYRVLKPDGMIMKISVRTTVMRSQESPIGYVTSVFEAK